MRCVSAMRDQAAVGRCGNGRPTIPAILACSGESRLGAVRHGSLGDGAKLPSVHGVLAPPLERESPIAVTRYSELAAVGPCAAALLALRRGD